MIGNCLFWNLIRVISFDHRKRVLPQILSEEDCPKNLTFHVNLEKSSSTAVYDYFSTILVGSEYHNVSWIMSPFHLQIRYI